MNAILTDFLQQLDLRPGERRCVTVDEYEVEIRRALADGDDGGMVNLRQGTLPSDRAITLVVQRGEPQLPTATQIDESDLAPE